MFSFSIKFEKRLLKKIPNKCKDVILWHRFTEFKFKNAKEMQEINLHLIYFGVLGRFDYIVH